MTNLRDIIRERNLYDSPVEEVLSILQNQQIRIEPEDYVDYVLNIGHRHRIVEQWNLYEGEKSEAEFSGNDYPERALYCTLAQRAVGNYFTGEIAQRLSLLLEVEYDLINLVQLQEHHRTNSYDNVRIEREELTRLLDQEEHQLQTRALAREFQRWYNLEEDSRDFCVTLMNVLKEKGVESGLKSYHIRFYPQYEKVLGDEKIPLSLHIPLILTHFIGRGKEGLYAFGKSQVFWKNFRNETLRPTFSLT